MQKLNPIKGGQRKLLAENVSLRSLSWAKNVRFYKIGRGTAFALGTVAKPLSREVTIAKLNKTTNAFEVHAKCHLNKKFKFRD